MFLTEAFLNLSINKPRIYKRNVFFLFTSLPSPRSSTVSHLLVQLLPSAGQNLSLIPLENANHHNKWFAFYNICLGKKQRRHPTTCFSNLFVVNFRDRFVCWDVLNKIEELCFDCSPQTNTILKVSCILKENGDLKGIQKFDGKQPNNRLEQVKLFSLAVLPTSLVTKLTVSRGITH